MRRMALAALAALAIGPALDAEAAEHDGEDGAEGMIELPDISGGAGAGLLVASGNTESQSANVDVNATFAWEIWRHKLKLSGYQASEDGEDTAERYTGSVQSDYRFSERGYLFVNGNYSSDRFGAFDRRASLTAGLGRRMLEREAMTLDLEAGLGRRISEPDGTNDREREDIVRLNGDYDWKFAATSRFTQSLQVQAGDDSTETESVSSIRSRLAADLSWRLSHTIVHNSEVPAGTDSTDTFTAVSIEYAF